MNFVWESFFAGPMRNSGSVWRSALATTNSDGGMSGRMVRSQDPKELQTSLGARTPSQEEIDRFDVAYKESAGKVLDEVRAMAEQIGISVELLHVSNAHPA